MENLNSQPEEKPDSHSEIMNMFIGYALEMRNTMKEGYEVRLKDILKKWDESKNLPRKAKKRMRKELLLDFSINEYGKDLFMF